VRVTLSPAALSKVFYVALSNREVEVAGFLLGQVREDQVLVIDSLWVGSRGGKAHVELDFNVMAKVVEELEKNGKDEVIVGWWHSHPGMGADFMSAIDVKTQYVWQSLFPYAIALIVDPAEYEKGGISEKSCRLYRIANSEYEAIPFDMTLELDDLSHTGLKSLQRTLRRGVGVTLTRMGEETYKERFTKRTRELIVLALSIWIIIFILLLWALFHVFSYMKKREE